MIQEIRLNSKGEILAPYAMKKLMEYYQNENEVGRKEVVQIVQKMWGLPEALAVDLLTGTIEWWREGRHLAFYVNPWSYGGWAHTLFYPKTSY